MIRSLHFHDAAGTAARLVAEARREGMDWQLMGSPTPLARTGPSAGALPGPAARDSDDRSAGRADSGPDATDAEPRAATVTVPARLRARVTGAARGAERLSRPLRGRLVAEYLRWKARPFDIMHVHGAHKAATARRIGRPLAVHLHGSDIRVMQYAPSTAASVRQGVLGADLVVYSTPDLLEHAQRVRGDVHYLPVPISTTDLPVPPPDAERQGILFVSRWEASKGGERMLEIAEHVRRADPSVPLYGLDWGDGAAAARRSGVTLLPKQPHEEFLRTVASHRVAIGQANPMIGTSELEAIGLGLPLIGSFRAEWYPGLGKLSGDSAAEQADAAIRAHREADAARREQDGIAFVRREHGTPQVLARLVDLYRRTDPSLS